MQNPRRGCRRPPSLLPTCSLRLTSCPRLSVLTPEESLSTLSVKANLLSPIWFCLPWEPSPNPTPSCATPHPPCHYRHFSLFWWPALPPKAGTLSGPPPALAQSFMPSASNLELPLGLSLGSGHRNPGERIFSPGQPRAGKVTPRPEPLSYGGSQPEMTSRA